MTAGDRGIDASPAFRAYMARLRENWEPADNYGEPAGNGHSEITEMTEATGETDAPNIEMNRRAFCIATAATGVALATGTGTVAADDGDLLDYSESITPNPGVSGEWTISDYEIGAGVVDYAPDDAESLADYGGVVAARDDEDEPHNPVEFRADYIDSDDYDGGALEADAWSENGLTVTDAETESGITAVEISGDGTATFSDADDGDFLLVGANVTDLGDSVEVSAGGETLTFDDTGYGIVKQTELADEPGDLEISTEGGSADLELFALATGDETEFGEREIDDDGDVETETISEPDGYVSATVDDDGELGLGVEGSITDLEVAVDLHAGERGEEWTDWQEAEPSDDDFDTALQVADSLEVPDYEFLSAGDLELVETVRHDDGYAAVESFDALEESLAVDDVDGDDEDDEPESESHTSVFDDAEEGERIVLADGLVAGDLVAVYQAIDLSDDDYDEITTTGVTGGFWSGGGESWLSTPAGVLTTIVSGVMGYTAIARGWVGNALSRVI